MTIKEFGECIEYNIEHNLKHAVLGLGAPGVGKSELIRQIGAKYGYKVIDIRLAQMSEVEIGGLIYPNESRTKTVWLAPDILPNEERDGKNTILLLDEITSCNKRVQVAAYQLILDRRIGEYHLPEGTFVVALGNREDDDGVYIKLAGPLADRFEIHYLEPSFSDWKYDFAIPHNVHPWIIDYLSTKPSALHTQTVDGEDMVFATPRSWVRVSDILSFDSDIDKKVIQHKIIGNIGEREGRQFIAFCRKRKENNLIDPMDFLNGKQKAPKEPDKIRVLISGMASTVDFLKNAESFSSLNTNQMQLVKKYIEKSFEFTLGEYTILALKQLIAINKPVATNALAEIDSKRICDFVEENKYMLGMDKEHEADAKSNKWLDMWGKK